MRRLKIALFLTLAVVLAGCETSKPSNQAPVITSPGNQISTIGDSINLTISATDPEKDALSFSATGLPDGLGIDTQGQISGSPTKVGNFSTGVFVDDGKGNNPSLRFDWVIKAKTTPEPQDTLAPTIISTDSTGNTSVVVVFSEAVKGADNSANYSVISDLSISAANVAADQKTVTLITSEQTENTSYALLVNQAVTDLAGNPYQAGNDEPFATTFFGTAPAALEPPGFKVGIAGYSAAESKLRVIIEDLELAGLETLEYRLERFSSSCTDAADVKTGELVATGSSLEFEILSSNYGAYKLSLTATYDAAKFQNPVKTILPLPSEEDLLDWGLSGLANSEGLVFIEVLNDFTVIQNVKQVFDDLPDSFTITADLQAQETDFITAITYDLKGLGTPDKKWCSSSGLEFTVSSGATVIQEEASTAFNKPFPESGPNTPYTFPAGPIAPVIVEGKRRLYTLYQAEVTEFFEVAGDPEAVGSAKHFFEFVVMDCLSEEFPEGISCADFNDIGR